MAKWDKLRIEQEAAEVAHLVIRAELKTGSLYENPGKPFERALAAAMSALLNRAMSEMSQPKPKAKPKAKVKA